MLQPGVEVAGSLLIFDSCLINFLPPSAAPKLNNFLLNFILHIIKISERQENLSNTYVKFSKFINFNRTDEFNKLF